MFGLAIGIQAGGIGGQERERVWSLPILDKVEINAADDMDVRAVALDESLNRSSKDGNLFEEAVMQALP